MRSSATERARGSELYRVERLDVAPRSQAVAIKIQLVRIEGAGAPVAGVADAIRVRVPLRWIGHGRANVVEVGSSVAVAVDLRIRWAGGG